MAQIERHSRTREKRPSLLPQREPGESVLCVLMGRGRRGDPGSGRGTWRSRGGGTRPCAGTFDQVVREEDGVWKLLFTEGGSWTLPHPLPSFQDEKIRGGGGRPSPSPPSGWIPSHTSRPLRGQTGAGAVSSVPWEPRMPGHPQPEEAEAVKRFDGEVVCVEDPAFVTASPWGQPPPE